MSNKTSFDDITIDENDSDDDSDSDFDDDEDPDAIEVPGGGIDLRTAAAYASKSSANKSTLDNLIPPKTPSSSQLPTATAAVVGGRPQQLIAAAGHKVLPGLGNSHGLAIPSSSATAATVFKGTPVPQLPKLPPPQPKLSIDDIVKQKVHKMITENPRFLTSGIPNDELDRIKKEALSEHQKQQQLLQAQQNQQLALLQQQLQQQQQQQQASLTMNTTIPEEEPEDDEELGVAETYADYMPSKLKLGVKHPDPVVETASLSSVEPANVYYKLAIPAETIHTGALSALQLESITYSCQAHDHYLLDKKTRAGFFVGDGAGVGKGRTIAGIIYENYLKGRKKSLWISVSNDLRYDAAKDLQDIGASNISVYALNKFKYAKINSSENNNVKKGVIFSTYSALIGESTSTEGKYKTRLKQLLQWCGDDFDGVIVFDECHKAKNLFPTGSTKPTKTGRTVLDLQNRLPKARVIYASATGASEPRNMAYMVRLGIWGQGTPFPTFNEFISAVEKRGIGAMEIVAMDMKLRGMYIARQLSFKGVSFKIEEVALSKNMRTVYDAAVELWVEAMNKFEEAARLCDAEARMKKTMWGQFWSSHQRFFKYLCIAAKVDHAVKIARNAVKYGKCVVIGLQSTGEARTLEQLERDDGELTDFVSTAKGVFQSLVEKHFPAPDRNRINRLLGLSTEASTSRNAASRKRKPDIEIAPAEKRRKSESDPESDADSSESESESDHDDSDMSSDDNPFKSRYSDSDDDPWVNKNAGRTKKKKKKATKEEKKSPSIPEKVPDVMKPPPLIQAPAFSISIGGPPKDKVDRACELKEELLRKIEVLGEDLPSNTLDQLIDELGGPDNVAEMTGRKGRVVQNDNGDIQYESRSESDVPLETLNLAEKERFMNGTKDVAIISEAASSGISLQSDRRVRNQKRRVHITLELPWSADRAIQQFGRTHRSNQVHAPEYIFLISDLAGERRFASTVAKRLESLGALTHGDRRATETRDLSQFNIDNKYGKQALEAVMKAIMGHDRPLVPPPRDYKGDFFKDISISLVGVGMLVYNDCGTLCLDKDYNNISRFLNRILGMKVDHQNRIFKYFNDTLCAVIMSARKLGRFDLGILDLGAASETVRQVRVIRFIRKHSTGVAPCELHEVQVERGMNWEEAVDKWADLDDPKEGFYVSQLTKNGRLNIVLAVLDETFKNELRPSKKDQIMFQIFRPNTGLQLRNESLAELEKKYRKIQSDAAERTWRSLYEASVDVCTHAYWRGSCRNAALGCEVGLRRRTYYVLSGSVLSVWARVEGILQTTPGANNRMQVIRLRTTEGKKIVGTIIPKNCISALVKSLSSDAERTETLAVEK